MNCEKSKTRRDEDKNTKDIDDNENAKTPKGEHENAKG
jgi:hypothetical protein